MLKRFFLGLAFALLAASQAQGAISLATLGGHNSPASSTNVITTSTNACAPGKTIVVFAAYVTTADTLSSATDSAGNTYQTPIDNNVGTGIGVAWVYAKNIANNLAAGGTITLTFAGTVTTFASAVCVTGLATTTPLDVFNQTANGLAATAATTTNTGTLRNTNEIIFGGLGTAAATGTNACGTGWTKDAIGQSGAPSVMFCHQIVASTSSVAFSPTWTNATNYVTDMISFSDTNAAGGTTPKGTLLGVGP